MCESIYVIWNSFIVSSKHLEGFATKSIILSESKDV